MILKAGEIHLPGNDYPTSDGKPMAETDHHRKLMSVLIETLEAWFLSRADTYVSGNLLIFYDKGNKRRHVSPDVFVVHGVSKGLRPNYLVWKEKTPDVVIELTSKTTRNEDTRTKRDLYERVLKVKEYFLFDPFEDYLDPSFQGFRRVRGKFRPIDPIDGRLPSAELGLHLERAMFDLRLRNPQTNERLPTTAERLEAAEQELRELRRRLGGQA
jgi:Uma2 family endonuclease